MWSIADDDCTHYYFYFYRCWYDDGCLLIFREEGNGGKRKMKKFWGIVIKTKWDSFWLGWLLSASFTSWLSIFEFAPAHPEILKWTCVLCVIIMVAGIVDYFR